MRVGADATGGPRSCAAAMGRTDARERVPPAQPFNGRAALLRGRNGKTDARGIPRPKAVREADALAGPRSRAAAIA